MKKLLILLALVALPLQAVNAQGEQKPSRLSVKVNMTKQVTDFSVWHNYQIVKDYGTGKEFLIITVIDSDGSRMEVKELSRYNIR